MMAGAGVVIHPVDLLERINALDSLGIKRTPAFKSMHHDTFEKVAELPGFDDGPEGAAIGQEQAG